MNKSNVRFLALLLSLTSCTPALGAMKNNDVIQKNQVMPVPIKPIVSSVYYFPKEKINTFGKPELDIFALCCSLNVSWPTFGTGQINSNDVRGYIADHFDEICELEILANPGVKLEWRGNFDLLGFQFPNNRTIEISVRDGNSGHTFVIVGKMYEHSMGENSWHFYVQDDIGIRENNVTKSIVNDLTVDVDWGIFDKSDIYRKQYFQNRDRFKQRFDLQMIGNMIRFIVRNKSLEEAKRLLSGRRVLGIKSSGGNGYSLTFNLGTPISVKPLKNRETSFDIRLNNCLVAHNGANLNFQLLRNDGSFWVPEVISVELI